jgi:hypothetical protein
MGALLAQWFVYLSWLHGIRSMRADGWQALAAGQSTAQGLIEANSARALCALAGPDLEDAVIATAAAIASETAFASCARRLLAQVEQCIPHGHPITSFVV